MYQRACFLRWNLCFRIGWSDMGLTKRRTNAKGQWSVNVERNSNLKKAPDDPTHLSTRRRINTSDKWRQQLVWKLTATRGISVGSDYLKLPSPISRRLAQKKATATQRLIWVGGLYKRLSLVIWSLLEFREVPHTSSTPPSQPMCLLITFLDLAHTLWVLELD